MKSKYTKELLEEKVKSSYSYSEVCRKLSLKPKGGTWFYIKKKIIEYNIDISHFLGKAAYTGKRRKLEHSNRKFSNESILVNNHSERIPARILRICLLDNNIKYKCNYCGISEWYGKTILLEIDHINNNCLDCRLENLQFLCPNCHSQKTYPKFEYKH